MQKSPFVFYVTMYLLCFSYYYIFSQSYIHPSKTIQTDWTFVKCKQLFMDEYGCREECDNLRIKENSIEVFDYPFKYISSYSFNKDFIIGNGVYYKTRVFDTIKQRNDTLIAYDKYLHHTHFYIKDTFDNSVISLLKKDTINTTLLKGKWNLVEKHQDEQGDEQARAKDGYIHPKFPFKVPKIIDFNKKKYSIKGTRIMIPIDGVMRDFYFVDIDNYSFSIRFGEWHKEYGLLIDYRNDFDENNKPTYIPYR